MVQRRDERRRCEGDYIVVWIETERDVIRDPENAVASTNHSFLVPTIGKSETWRELLLIQGQVVPARVYSVADQLRIPDTRGSRVTVATRNRGVGYGRIPITQAVVTVRPGSRKLIAESQVEGQFVVDLPSVRAVEAAVGLTASRLRRNLGRTFCLVHEGSRSGLR